MLPNVPAGCRQNALVLNQWFGSPVMSEAGSTPGLQRLGRSSPEVLPSRDQFDVAIDGENGSPLCSETIELICQPVSSGFCLYPGISHVPLAENTWRMSNAAGPQSAFWLYGFIAYTEVLTESTPNCACVSSIVLLRV